LRGLGRRRCGRFGGRSEVTWIAIAVGLGVALLDWRVTRWNQGSEWNGYGAVGRTLNKANLAPMRYRVLVPWLLWLIGWAATQVRRRDVWVGPAVYQAVKAALIVGALAVWGMVLGPAGALAVGLVFALTLEFDYWDQYAEALGLGLVVLGTALRQAQGPGGWYGVVIAALGALVWGLSRETVMLAPVVAAILIWGAAEPGAQGGGPSWGSAHGAAVPGAALRPFDPSTGSGYDRLRVRQAQGAALIAAGMVGPAARWAVRRIQGPAALYCERWMARRNWRDLVGAWDPSTLRHAQGTTGSGRVGGDAGMAMSLLATGGVIAYLLAQIGWRLSTPIAQVVVMAPALAMVGAAWTLARARETRVMIPAVLWVMASWNV